MNPDCLEFDWNETREIILGVIKKCKTMTMNNNISMS